MTIIRPYVTGDAEEWVRLTNLARGHALSVERFLQGESREGSAPWRVVAVTGGAQGETVVGVAELRAFPYSPGRVAAGDAGRHAGRAGGAGWVAPWKAQCGPRWSACRRPGRDRWASP